MASVWQDLRYALRQMRKAPGFALTVICTLALGIGATAAIYSLVDGVLLKPLGYRDGGQLVVVWEHVRYLEKLFPYTGPNPRHFLNWRQGQTDFTDMALVNERLTGVRLSGEHPRFVGELQTEPNLLHLLGMQPAMGHDFDPEDGRPGRDDRVLISWQLWQTLFGGDRAVVGKTLQVGRKPMQVIGVLPKRFYFPKANELTDARVVQQMPPVDVLVPAKLNPSDVGWNGDYGNWTALGRLRPGVTPAAAQAQLNTLSQHLVQQAPAGAFDGGPKDALSTVVEPLKTAVVGETNRALWLLLGAVLSLLLVACTNLAQAQLARVMARDREAAVRTALGASAWSLLRASMAETVLLAFAGGTLGVVLAEATVHHFAGLLQLAVPRAQTLAVNGPILLASILCTAGSALLFGALPALRFLRARPQASLQSGSRSQGSERASKLRRWLIGGQVLACTALLLLTGIFGKSLLRLLRSDKGFSTEQVVMASVRLQGRPYTDAQVASFQDAALSKLQGLPGVESAAVVSSMLSQGQRWLDGVQRTDRPSGQAALAEYRWISPGYFTTLRQPILEGRALDDRDRTLKSAVITKAAAEAIWPGQDPLGRSFRRDGTTYTVVGVAAGARSNSLRDAPASMVYLPYWDNPPFQAFLLVRGRENTEGTQQLEEAVRRTIWNLDPSVTIADLRPLAAELSDTLTTERLETMLLGSFGTAAMLLALLGVYGTLSYAVQRRTQEFGVRMALGATRAHVYWITLQELLLPIATGLAGGWLASAATGRGVQSLVYGAGGANAQIALPIVTGLFGAALLAAYLPCRRASRLEPMDALRAE